VRRLGGRGDKGLPTRFCRAWLDTRLQLVGELALFGDGSEDGGAALGEVAEVGELLFMSRSGLRRGCRWLPCGSGPMKGTVSAVVEQFNDGDEPRIGMFKVWAI